MLKICLKWPPTLTLALCRKWAIRYTREQRPDRCYNWIYHVGTHTFWVMLSQMKEGTHKDISISADKHISMISPASIALLLSSLDCWTAFNMLLSYNRRQQTTKPFVTWSQHVPALISSLLRGIQNNSNDNQHKARIGVSWKQGNTYTDTILKASLLWKWHFCVRLRLVHTLQPSPA